MDVFLWGAIANAQMCSGLPCLGSSDALEQNSLWRLRLGSEELRKL